MLFLHVLFNLIGLHGPRPRKTANGVVGVPVRVRIVGPDGTRHECAAENAILRPHVPARSDATGSVIRDGREADLVITCRVGFTLPDAAEMPTVGKSPAGRPTDAQRVCQER